MAQKSKTQIEYRRPGTVDPVPPSHWRQRGMVIGAGALLLLALIAFFAGPSGPVVFSQLIIDGPLLALWLLAAAGYGATILPLPEGEKGTGLRVVTCIGFGLGFMGTAELLIGLAGGIHRAIAFAIIVIGIALLLVRVRRMAHRDVIDWLTASADWDWLWLLVLPLLAMSIVAAYAPPGVLWGDEPHGYDVLEYHLQLPREWLELGRIVPLNHNVFSYFPLGVEMHDLLAMQLSGGAWAGMYLAQLMHVAFIALTIVAIYATARKLADKFPAIVAALAAASVPWMFLLAPVAYNEGGMLLFSTLAIGWLMRSLSAAENATIGPNGEHLRAPACLRSWVIAGMFAGLACGTKLTAVPEVLVILPIVAGVVGWWRGQNRILLGMASFVVAGVLVSSPWLIRNMVWAGNPVFPEAQSVFGHAHFTPEQTERWRRAHIPTPDQQSVKARLIAARQQILFDWRYGFALWLPAIVGIYASLRRPQAKVFVGLIIAWLMFWIGFTHLQGRFFVLAIPVAALGIALMNYRWQQLEMTMLYSLVLVQFLLGMWLSLRQFSDRVKPIAEVRVLGFDDFRQMLSQQADTAIENGHTIGLIGDARAFLYPVPMSRLRYRTVFDVDAKAGESILDSWLGDQGAGAEKVIDAIELDRFSKTYYGIPAIPPATTMPGH